MPNRRFANRIIRRYGASVADLFGTSAGPISVEVVKGLSRTSGDGRLAQAGVGTGSIQIDRRYLRTGSRADVRGALIHEMAHALGQGSETSADFARYALNRRENPNWSPSEEVRAMANQMGVNGPRPQRTTGRNRNTVVNNASHGAGMPAPPVSPGSAVSAGDQMAQGTYQYLQQLALLKQQAAMLRGQRRQSIADARATRVQEMAGTVNSALDRGILNSSVDLAGRAGVIANQAAAKVQAQQQFAQGMLATKMDTLDAQAQYAQLMNSIAAQQAAERMALLQEAYMNGLYDPAAAARASRRGERPRRVQGANAQPYQDYQGNLIDPRTGGIVGGTYGPPTMMDPTLAFIQNRMAAGRM